MEETDAPGSGYHQEFEVLKMLRSTTFRSLIALVLAAWMPFCCCTFTGVLNICTSCKPHEPSSENAVAKDHHAVPTGHGCHHEHQDRGSSPGDSDRPSHHDDDPCTCGKDKLATIGGEPISIGFPAFLLVCVLPDWEATWGAPARGPTLDRADFALHKPPTTLLRLHCALTI